MNFAAQLLALLAFYIGTSAYLSLVERKVIGRVQRRLGPSYHGIFGIIQPIADMLKIFFKRDSLKGKSKLSIFSVCLLLSTNLYLVAMMPLSDNLHWLNSNYDLLVILIISSIISISEILLGVSTNSKYAVIGSFRSFIQHVCYFIPLIIIVIIVFKTTGSLNLIEIANSHTSIWIYGPLAIISAIVFLMMINRTPFDLPEAESELVAGNYVEYGGILFGMIYLSEYLHIISAASLFNIIFLGGWNSIIFGYLPCPISCLLKTFAIVCIVFVIRATLSRYKQEDAIRLSFKTLTPILVCLALIA